MGGGRLLGRWRRGGLFALRVRGGLIAARGMLLLLMGGMGVEVWFCPMV